MDRRQHYQNGKAVLYLIPTPIGNLGDITFRAVETLRTVDHLFAEDTRVTQVLLNHLAIRRELRSCHAHNEKTVAPAILEALRAGKNVGIVTDAGMPLISDPGFEVARAAIADGHNVVALPGANAALTALAMAGLPPYPFLFAGFPDHHQGKRAKQLEELSQRTETLVFYEAPHRLRETLSDMYRAFGDRKAVVLRELTKKFEESVRGTLSELAAVEDWIGEAVVIVAGASPDDVSAPVVDVRQAVDAFVTEGLTRSEAMKRVAARLGVTKSVVYRRYLEST